MTLFLDYESKRLILDKDTIKIFKINPKDRRMIRQGKVREISNSIVSGNHFSSPFVINDKNGIYKIIDANHRYEAIVFIIKSDPDFKIEVNLAIYKNLSEDEERKVYRTWNIGTTQSSNDFLKAYFSSIPLNNEITKRLPVNIYGDATHLTARNFVGCQIDAKKNQEFKGSYSAGRELTVYDFNNLTLTDISLLEDFYDFMVKTFGAYHKKTNNQFYQTTPLSVFYRIWYDNRHIPQIRMIQLFQKVFGKDAKSWEGYTKSGGRSASVTFYAIALTTLIKQSGKTMTIKSDVEAIEDRLKESESGSF